MATANENIILKDMQGHVGKQIVVKKYGNRTIISKFPDMSHVKPSTHQKKQRNTFTDAIAYAKSILADPIAKEAYIQKLPPSKTVYHYAIQEYLSQLPK
ncbi:hypothetical protein [Parasediminibacterium sp. JCM 36343]|uniref:hypothetical protein n=1 Tax=Parasediminibacterium sp. JCM 36343 TaxID=3374279 RepID=UPI0039782D02